MARVVFPCDQATWEEVKDGLRLLKEICTQEDCDLKLIAETHQTIVNRNLGLGDYGVVSFDNTVFFGLAKYLRKHSRDERNRFLQVTLPSIIDLALKVKDLLPTEGIEINVQQKGETRAIDRKLCCSILACAFLCLFPNEQRGFGGSKLNNINFDKFFAHLHILSQNAKLRCILHFFDRVTTEWDRLAGLVLFTRQVIKRDELPTLDTWLNCTAQLCDLQVHQEGLIEDAGFDSIEVDFANRYIGGGVLSRGRVQEEIRFTVCPELIVSLLFMEVMEENEAIVIKGYEQFASTVGYASGLTFVGDHRDQAEVDEDEALRNTLCAIDAISYRHDHDGVIGKQYQDHFVLRDINKAFAGFCTPFIIPPDVARMTSTSEEDYFTAEDDIDSDQSEDNLDLECINHYVDDLLRTALSLAVPEAASTHSPNYVGRKNPRKQHEHPDLDESLNNQYTASAEEVPMAHLEVNFRDWYTHYRRRSSNLSDLSSRRSSYDLSRRSSACSNRGYSSEFSSEFEEYFDNFQQQEQRYKYHTIKEEVGNSLVNEFAANLAASLLQQGTAEALHTDHGVQDFHCDQPKDVENKPRPVRVSDIGLEYSGGISNIDKDPVRNYVENMFQKIWPFGVKEETKVQSHSGEKEYLRERILDEYCFQLDIPDTLQNTENETEDNDDEDGDSGTEHDSPVPEEDGESDEGIPVDETVLVDIADRLVNLAFEEALVEYKYRYILNYSRKFEAQISSESSQSDHSIDLMDQSERGRQAQTFESTQSNKYDLSAITVADRVMSELFRPDDGGETEDIIGESKESQSNIPNIESCDNFKASEAVTTPQLQIHSRSVGDTDKQSDKRLEMYSRIADKLLMGGFSSKSVDEGPKANLDSEVSDFQLNLNQSCDSAHGQPVDQSQTRMLSHSTTDQSQISDLKVDKPVMSSSPSNCDPLSSHSLSSVNMNNQLPSNLENSAKTSGLKTEIQPSSSPEKSKSSPVFAKWSSSSSSESKCAIHVEDSFYISNSSSGEIDGKNKIYIAIPDGSNSPLNHSSSPLNQSSGSDKTGSESSAPKLPQTGSKKKRSADMKGEKHAARPKVKQHLKKESHHIVGNKKNYDQFANSLSRDLLTNAFLQVQEHSEYITYPRRSSEPMQISNGAALQRLEHSIQKINGKRAQKSKTAEDISQFEEGWVQSESFCGRDYRSSSGFRDPVLSRFAEELMKANVAVPTLQLLSDCVSTSGSSRSVCSTVSSFRDPLLATFEEELVNSTSWKSSAKTQMSWSKMKGSMCSPRQNNSRSNQNNNNGGNYGNSNHSSNSNHGSSSRKQRVNRTSMESEASCISWKSYKSNSVVICSEDVTEFAELLARRIMCEAMTAAYCKTNLDTVGRSDMERRTRMTLDMYGDMLSRNILKSAVLDARNQQVCSDWLEQNRIVTWSEETECLEYSEEENTDTSDNNSDDDRLVLKSPESGSSSLEYEDALDIPYKRLEEFADFLASKVLINSVAISRRERISTLRKQYGRPLATGNWGCGAFCGDPHLKSLLQWMAASYAGAPKMFYFTFNHPGMTQLQNVVDTVIDRGWDVSKLMQAVRRYCITAESEIRVNGVASHDLFEVILQGEFFPGI